MYSTLKRPLAEVTNWSHSFGGRPTDVAKPDYRYWNSILNRYHSDFVPVDREKSNLISRHVLPLVEKLLVEINAKDERFGKEIVRVGSSTQGLTVNTKGDYDFSVVFKLEPNEDSNHPFNQLFWTNRKKPVYYGFEDSEENDTLSLRKNFKIVRKDVSLLHPGFGYLRVTLRRPCSDSSDSDSCGSDYNGSDYDDSDYDGSDYDGSDYDDSDLNDSDPESLQFDGDLIPHLVKCRFKALLQDALKTLKLNDDLTMSRGAHGPALTLRTEVTTNDGKRHPVSIDLAIIIRARLEFIPKMGWPVSERARPVSYTSWPPPEKVDAIVEKGINIVAKKPFFWYVSFVELEKILVGNIDEDRGCRKKVHRIMKSVFYNVCKDQPVLTSYMLKNVWFMECEKYPDPESWQPENLAERYFSCLERLCENVRRGRLPQYFNRSVNLLKKKNVEEDVEKIWHFDFNKAVNKKRQAEDASVLQPPKKMPRIYK